MFIAVLYSAPGLRPFCTKTKLFIICRETKTRAHMHANISANDMLRSPQHGPRFVLCMLGRYCVVILFMKLLRYDNFTKHYISSTSRCASLIAQCLCLQLRHKSHVTCAAFFEIGF
ncbi:hypothetical protein HOLleu_43220 [Holothuria leucospilota]|uniref:Uncharacterized protein n=1 Tax=Holothuria leucospilota TaxID=206669 RepID=A0A9Q0Y9W2_HOLLE|nr:hypothetical protein HOLleu_43220 [Holothuria leucospilota]